MDYEIDNILILQSTANAAAISNQLIDRVLRNKVL